MLHLFHGQKGKLGLIILIPNLSSVMYDLNMKAQFKPNQINTTSLLTFHACCWSTVQ